MTTNDVILAAWLDGGSGDLNLDSSMDPYVAYTRAVMAVARDDQYAPPDDSDVAYIAYGFKFGLPSSKVANRLIPF